MWRPAFPFVESHAALLRGWSRRFWQGSTDHRGVPGSPGRVVTLVSDPDASCWGVVYRVAPDAAERVLAELDHREKGGYDRLHVTLELRGPDRRIEGGLVYVANDRNPNYLGPAPLDAIVAQVLRSRGPSGDNVEYVLSLAARLRSLGAEDAHVEQVAGQVERARGGGSD